MLSGTKWALLTMLRRQLADDGTAVPVGRGKKAAKRPKHSAYAIHRPARAEVEASIQRRNAEGPLKGRLLCADVSAGKELVGPLCRRLLAWCLCKGGDCRSGWGCGAGSREARAVVCATALLLPSRWQHTRLHG